MFKRVGPKLVAKALRPAGTAVPLMPGNEFVSVPGGGGVAMRPMGDTLLVDAFHFVNTLLPVRLRL